MDVSRELSLYRRTKAALAFLLLVYLVAVLETERVRGRDELFPFASWSLFSFVPNETRDYSIRILEVDGEVLAEPVFFEQAAHLVPGPTDHAAYITIQKLGKAIESDDGSAEGEARRRLEDLHLRGIPVRYELVFRRFDPLELWRSHSYREVRTLPLHDPSKPR